MRFRDILTSYARVQHPREYDASVPRPTPIRKTLSRPGFGFFRRRVSAGLSEEMSFDGLAEDTGFWSGLGQVLGAAGTKLIDAKAQAEVLKAQAGLYTPQNIETARRKAEFENAQAGGMSTGAMIGLGLGAVALAVFLAKKG